MVFDWCCKSWGCFVVGVDEEGVYTVGLETGGRGASKSKGTVQNVILPAHQTALFAHLSPLYPTTTHKNGQKKY